MSAPLGDGLVVTTNTGALRGVAGGGVRFFHGVPYAAAPVGALRFAPPAAMSTWTGVREAIEHGPIAPQARGRLAPIMGEYARPQDEDCLTLTITAPPPGGRPAPVIVFLHGGAYMSGAGSLDWYSGERFAEEGIVFVGVNHRLGALGYLHSPGISTGNLGLLDQRAALLWIHENIAAFGGDPSNVTLMGQSAGAAAIVALMAMPDARRIFRRAILQSASLGRLVQPAAMARAQAERFLAVLGLEEGNAARLRDIPPLEMIAAQSEFARREKRFADSRPPFQPVLDGTVISTSPLEAVARGAAAGLDLIVGTTRDEMAAFYAFDLAVKEADEPQVRGVFAEILGTEGEAHLDEFRRMLPTGRPAQLLGALYADQWFRMPSLELAEAVAAHGGKAFVYQFDWPSPTGFGACHCIDLPFAFANPNAWRESPMLAGADEAERAGITRAMHGAWLAFARTGRPDHEHLPPWAPYSPARRTTMRFDRIIEPMDDPAGRSWRRPWPRG